jgi:uncharacterized protein YdiU (UPF0061 family)
MEAYDPAAVFSSIDHGGRYAYANQPLIARWNLARFAETLLPLMAEADDEAARQRAVAQALEVIDAFPDRHAAALLRGQRAKLGIGAATPADDEADASLAAEWLALLHAQAVDFTLAWWHLADAAAGRDAALRALFADAAALQPWLDRWHERLGRDDASAAVSAADRAARMRRVNPWIIPRNHHVEHALAAASNDDDLAPFERLLAALRRPFEQSNELAPFAEPAPAEVTAGYQTFCGT